MDVTPDLPGDPTNPSGEPANMPAASPSDNIDMPRLRRLLGTPELSWLVERVRRRMAREEPLTGQVSLTGPNDAQRAAAERLLGRAPGAGRSLTVRLDAVDETLRRSGICPGGLATAVVALTGRVERVRETREREGRAWAEAYAPLDDLPRQLAAWAARLRGEGLVRRLARTPEVARDLLADTVKVLSVVPCDPPVSLPAFAARVLGSAHALDDGTPLATLALSGIRVLTGVQHGTGARGRREVWAAAGLLRDDVSSTVLTLNVRGGPALDRMADEGEPAVLTLRQLSCRERIPTPVAVIRVCENPTVLSAAADAYGPKCPPLICVQGQPSAAALTLLRQAHAQGVSLQYHGDFDWGGLRIAAGLLRHVPWRPWRYTAADYLRSAAALASSAPRLSGTPVAAPWDAELTRVLDEWRVRVEEESVLDDLLTDLAR